MNLYFPVRFIFLKIKLNNVTQDIGLCHEGPSFICILRSNFLFKSKSMMRRVDCILEFFKSAATANLREEWQMLSRIVGLDLG